MAGFHGFDVSDDFHGSDGFHGSHNSHSSNASKGFNGNNGQIIFWAEDPDYYDYYYYKLLLMELTAPPQLKIIKNALPNTLRVVLPESSLEANSESAPLALGLNFSKNCRHKSIHFFASTHLTKHWNIPS